MKRILVILLAATALAIGCTPEAYRHDADREVQRILRERKSSALGYEPQAAPSDAAGPRAEKGDYQKIPLTAIPPPAPPAPPAMVTAPPRELPYGPLGPERDLPPVSDAASPMTQPARIDELGVAADEEEIDAVVRSAVAGPPAPSEQAHRFDLFAALKYAVQNSRPYQDRMEDLYLAALDVTLERHLFAPRPFARTGAEYTGGQADVNYRSALAATASAGVRQQLPYGGEIVAETLVRFVTAIEGEVEDGESADLVLSGSLPLLRGAGLVNLEPLINSERQLVYEVRDFEAFRRAFAVDIASRYFALLAQQQAISNRLQNYATLNALLERARALYDATRISFLEVQRAEQSLLSGENALVDARLSYANALDAFKIALGMDVNESLIIVPVELDVAMPEIGGTAGLEAAYRYRLELQTASDRVGDSARQVEVARNGLLPDLDLTARVIGGNRPNTSARQLDSRTLEYSAGLQLDLPVDRVAERNAYRRALIGFDRAQRGFEDLRDQVTAQVRAGIRGIRSAEASLVIQGQAVELAERRVELANLRFQFQAAGFDTRETVEAQEDLLAAQDAYERARANLQIEILEFLRDTGTLRVDPAAGELGQALYRESPPRERDASGNADVNGGRASQ